MSMNDPPAVKPDMFDPELDGIAESSVGVDGIPVRPGRELIEVSRQDARCYRLKKIECRKKGCRCGKGKHHGRKQTRRGLDVHHHFTSKAT